MPDDSLVLTPALVVEDDLSMQRRIARLLGDVEPGAEVVVTGSLVGARELLAAREFSIALVDIGLPDGNGCELIAWLNRHRPDMQVLVIFAWGDERSEEHTSELQSLMRISYAVFCLKKKKET